MAKPVVQLHDVSFSYHDEHVLDHINLEVEAGEYLGVIGPNGGGKTTLLKLMLGLLEPQAGQVKLFGRPVSNFRDWPRVGYVPQRAAGQPGGLPITAREVVEFGRIARAGLLRRLSAADHKAVAAAMDKVDVAGLGDRLIAELSGGQQQRVFLAKALASEPDILLLDEPTVGVDMSSQESFYQLLSRLNAREKLTLVLVSHDIDVVVNEVTRLACINESLVYHGAPKEFMKADYLEKLYGKGRKFILHGH